jgi:hypothetical protein
MKRPHARGDPCQLLFFNLYLEHADVRNRVVGVDFVLEQQAHQADQDVAANRFRDASRHRPLPADEMGWRGLPLKPRRSQVARFHV